MITHLETIIKCKYIFLFSVLVDYYTITYYILVINITKYINMEKQVKISIDNHAAIKMIAQSRRYIYGSNLS